MTAIAAVASTQPVEIDQQLLGYLREIHARWLQVVRGVLKAARPADAGTWTRWSAIRYVNTAFSTRFERERAAVDSLLRRHRNVRRPRHQRLGVSRAQVHRIPPRREAAGIRRTQG